MFLFSYGLYLLFADHPINSELGQATAQIEKSLADQKSSDASNMEQLDDDLFDNPESLDETDENLDEPGTTLPNLDHSDSLVRESALSLSSESVLKGWLGVDQLLRRFVTLVDNIQRGSIPRKQLSFLRPQGRFKVTNSADYGAVIDPASYQRYNGFADALASLDPSATADLYRQFKPLIKRAYKELGNPPVDFDQVLFGAIGHLQKTPILEGEVALVQPSVMYKFKDKDIEKLSAAQKQLIRTGPRNTRIIQRKLAAFASAVKQLE